MTAEQLDASIAQSLALIQASDDESLLQRAARYLQRLATPKPDPTLMSYDDFVARIDESKRQYEQGRYKTVRTKEELHALLDSL